MTTSQRKLSTAALSLLGASSRKDSWVQELHEFALTSEQAAIVECDARLIRVIAFAGSGKTSTLVIYAKRRRHMRFLYIAFNSVIQKEASRKFPPNVECRTPHSLAYEEFGARYAAAGKLVDTNRVNTVAAALGLSDEMAVEAAYVMARAALDALDNFLSSADLVMNVDTVSVRPDAGGPTDGGVMAYAQRLWGMMCDMNDTRVGMTHDGYLKLFQMSKPRLSGYDCILLDEAQDTNPVVSQIVLSQNCAKVLVGDRHQQLYSFRGARDALDQFHADATFYLTTSFRFGPMVAGVANALLSSFKGETHRVVGKKDGGAVCPVDQSKTYTIISRTNAALFDHAVSTVMAGKSPHFVGGIDGYKLWGVRDAYHLLVGENDLIKNAYLRSFRSFGQMEEYADLADDKELKSLCRVVAKYGNQIPPLLDQITKAAAQTQVSADVCLTTAHKGKGLEFDQVLLSNDFTDLVDKDGAPLPAALVDPEEINILYVAATRAMKVLQPNEELGAFLLRAGEKKPI